MTFEDLIPHIAAAARPEHAQAVIRALHGRHASRWLATHAGLAPRTARRWLSTRYPGGRKREITAAAVAAAVEAFGGDAGARYLAAQRLRTAQSIDVGSVEVDYDDEPQGRRTIGHRNVDAISSRYLASAAGYLEAGLLDEAAYKVSDAVVNLYEHGLENTLQIAEYSQGIEIRP
ncbi:hypothetical protein [Amycolatopsis sp. NPDC054798]